MSSDYSMYEALVATLCKHIDGGGGEGDGDWRTAQLLSLQNECVNKVESGEREISALLSRLDPRALRENWECFGQSALLREVGVGRFLWATIALACGKDTSRRGVCALVSECASWIDAFRTQVMLGGILAGPGEVDKFLSAQDHLRRIFQVETRFPWITEEIFKAALGSVPNDPSANASTWPSTFFEALKRTSLDPSSYSGNSVDPVLTQDPFGILEAASLEPGSRHGRSFSRMFFSREVELLPFFRWPVQNEEAGPRYEYWAADLRTATLGLEVALFDALSNLGVDKGELFERAVRRLVRKWWPNKFDVIECPAKITGDPADELETDLALSLNGRIVLVGDAKSYSPSSRVGPSMFDDRYGKGYGQVAKRVRALMAGESLAAPCHKSNAVIPGADEVAGLVVTLHSCGGAVWDKRALSENRCGTKYGIIPLHQLVLIGSLFPSAADVLIYLRDRHRILESGLRVFDELELLLLGMSEEAVKQSRIKEASKASSRGVALTYGYSVDPYTALLRRAPCRSEVGRLNWMHWLHRASVRNPNSRLLDTVIGNSRNSRSRS